MMTIDDRPQVLHDSDMMVPSSVCADIALVHMIAETLKIGLAMNKGELSLNESNHNSAPLRRVFNNLTLAES
jgi:hypothetical protein